MSWVAAAIGGSALIGAGTSLYASSRQSDSANQGIDFQKAVFAQNQQNIKPYLEAGNTALGRLDQSYADPGSFSSSPDYQFGVREGTGALENSAAARGGMLGGNFLRRATQFGQDYGYNYLTNYRQGLQTTANMGASVASAGNANATQAANNIQGGYNYLGGAQASGAVGATNALTGGVQNYLLYNALNRSSYGGAPAIGAGGPGGA